MTPQRRARRPWPHCRGGHAGFGALVVVWLLSTPGEAQAQASIQATTPFSSWDTIQISGSVQTDGDFEDWCAQNNCYILDKVAWADVGGGGGFQGGHYESWGSDEVAFQTTDTGPPQTMQARTYYVQGGVTWTFCINLPPSCETYTDQHDEHWNAQFTAQPATTIDSFAPTSGSGGAQTFSMQIGNPAGANDLYVVLLRVSQTAGWPPWANECVVRYWRPTNTLEIIDDAGNGGGSAVVGTGGWLENSRCRANAAGATAVLGGTTLTLTIPMEFKPLYAGAKNLYVLAYNMAQQGILWKDVGDWTVTVPCQYTVTPGSPSLASSSGNLTFSIATMPECPWSAPATSGFLTRTTGGSGSGAGQVSYSYPENPNTSSRSTQPTIASQAITVTQVGDGQSPLGDEVVYYHHDAIGSVRVVSDSSGNVVRRHDLLPFGQEWQPQSSGDRLLFTSQERDPETGLDYFESRYYGSFADRFASPDPLATAVSKLFQPYTLNRYAYARLNPLRYVDPTGLLECNLKEAEEALDGRCTEFVNVNAGLGPAMLQAIRASEGFTIVIPSEPEVFVDPSPESDGPSIVRQVAGFVPVVGSALDSYDAFKCGNYGAAAMHFGLAAIDLTGAAAVTKGLKVGAFAWRHRAALNSVYGPGRSMKWPNVRKRMLRQNLVTPNEPTHHVIFQQGAGWPDWLTNHRANLMPDIAQGAHDAAHYGNALDYLSYGTPTWMKLTAGGAASSIAGAATDAGASCN